MKFIAKKSAPDIPLEILEAQEADQLVFFCGAGISYPAGLPGFEDLVNHVYTALTLDKSIIEKSAIKSGFFDRAINSLEQRVSRTLIRKTLIDRLSIASDSNLATHKAILGLSKTKHGGNRLVTTNVDLGFRTAMPNILIDVAPKLPIPKPHKWQSVVQLHGMIDETNDPDGENLIFTSGDLGLAYLTEGWASRFVTDLFRHFTVLFIGYSLNDPVLRYITDAIAAEKSRGDKDFFQPYLLAHATESKSDAERSKWKSKGVEPIFYSDKHTNLHNTIIAWAKYSHDGLNGKEQIIKNEAIKIPLQPYDKDDSIRRVIDILKEKTNPNHENITGFPASIFKKIKAPIEWLPVLYKEGLLSIATHQDNLFSVSNNATDNLLNPNVITLTLWEWLVQYLDSVILIKWIIEKGGHLHPTLKRYINNLLENDKKLNEDYLTFWRIVVSDHVRQKLPINTVAYNAIREINQNNNVITMSLFTKAIEPGFYLTKSITYDDRCKNNAHIRPYDVNVVIPLSNSSYKEMKKILGYPNRFINLLLPVTNALDNALQFWEFIGKANDRSDPSYYDMASIKPHEQNHFFSSWVILIELCRDLWESAQKSNHALAHAIVQLWRSLKYPTFRRLVLHAYTYETVINVDSALDYLLEDENWWLWSLQVRREKFRLLSNIWSRLSEASVAKLLRIVLAGPPRAMYRESLTNDEWNEISDREVWLLLAKLKSFGRSLSEIAETKLRGLSQKHPLWKLQDNEQDEFTHWLEIRWGREVDIDREELFSLPTPDLIKELSESSPRYLEGRIDLFRQFCKSNSDKAVEIITYLKNNSNWNGHIWHAVLIGLADSSDPSWINVAVLLQDADIDLYAKEARAIAWWTREALKKIDSYSLHEKYFWQIANKLLGATKDGIQSQDKSNIITYALNHPIGIMTEAFIERLAKSNLNAGDRISDSNYLNYINKVASNNAGNYLSARVILASRLYYFYMIDVAWTKCHLLPAFDIDTSYEALILWEGYLWSPKISVDLALDLKMMMLKILKNIALLSNNSAEQLCYIFTYICLTYPDLYSPKEQHEALTNIGNKYLEYVLKYIFFSLTQDISDTFWNSRIKPFIWRSWPKEIIFVNQKTSEYFALICIELKDSFADAINLIKPLIKPFKDLTFFLNQLELKSLTEEKPYETLDLLATVFTDKYDYPSESLRKIADRLLQAQSNIKDDPRFKKINNHLLQHGL